MRDLATLMYHDALVRSAVLSARRVISRKPRAVTATDVATQAMKYLPDGEAITFDDVRAEAAMQLRRAYGG